MPFTSLRRVLLACCVAVTLTAACIPTDPAPTETPSREELRDMPTPTPPAWQEPFTPVTLANVDEVRFIGRLDPPSVGAGSVFNFAFSIDGTRLAALNQEQLVVWDLITGEIVFTAARRDLLRVYYSPDKTSLYAFDPSGLVHVLDGESGFQETVFEAHPDFVDGQHAYYAPGGLFAANSVQGEVRVWDAVEREVLANLPTRNADLIQIVFSGDGERIAVGDALGNAQVWDWRSEEQLATFPGDLPLVRLALSPDGSQVAAATAEDIRVWDITNPDEVQHILLTGEGGAADVLTYTQDGRYIVNSGLTEAMNVWNAETGELVAALPELGGEFTALAFSPDGDLMLTSVFQGGVLVWDITAMDADRLGRAALDVTTNIIDVAWAPDGRTLALFAANGTVQIWGIPPEPPPAVTEEAEAAG